MSSSFPAARFPVLPLGKEREATEPHCEDVRPPAEQLSDETLISRICADDTGELGLLFHRYARLVWTVARKILRNNEEADDLLQDVFLHVRRKASSFDGAKGSFRSFLVHMTYQRAISRRRYLMTRHFYCSNDSEKDSTDLIPAPAISMYDESVEAHLGRDGLRRALTEMSAEQRETLRLHFFEGYSLEEIAVHVGRSYRNVRHYYYRGLDKLRRQIPKQK